jgi:hypothetical protein
MTVKSFNFAAVSDAEPIASEYTPQTVSNILYDVWDPEEWENLKEFPGMRP